MVCSTMKSYEAQQRLTEALSACQEPEELTKIRSEELWESFEQAQTVQAELQRQNDRLQRSEKELREVIESIPGMAWTGAPDGSCTFVNRRWSEYTGLSLEDTAGSGWQTAVYPEDLERTVEKWRESIATGEPFEHEMRFRRAADGQYRWFLVRGVPLRDEHGEVLKWSGIATDIADRKRAEEAEGVKINRLQLLLKLANQITSNLELRELLRAISANIRQVMQCDAVAISLPDPDSGNLRLYALDFPDAKGFAKEDLLTPRTENDPSFRALQTLKSVIVSTSDADNFSPEAREVVAAEGLKAISCIPLVNHRRAVGVLGVARKTEKPFTQEDVEFLGQISGQIAIAIENALAYQEISQLKDRLAQEKVYLEGEIRSEMNFEEIVGKSAALRRVLKEVEIVGPTDSTVLIYGETGTGKELIARALHDLSPRRSGAFVKLNCAAIPTGLLESELFGHEKGAFTGAIAQRIGRFELANHGTVFLDEIGEIPLELQPKLLRVLQEREFERLGGTRTLRTDSRLVAATNRNLAAMVEQGKFRSDLYYRLNVFPIRVPALCERPEDIPLLVRHFTRQFARRMNKDIESIPSETMSALCEYDWPGNIRELQNVIERAVILTHGPVLKVNFSDLKSNFEHRDDEQEMLETPQALRRILEETERKQVTAALEASRWVIAGPNGAAARLGMKRSTLQLRIHKLGIARSNKATE